MRLRTKLLTAVVAGLSLVSAGQAPADTVTVDDVSVTAGPGAGQSTFTYSARLDEIANPAGPGPDAQIQGSAAVVTSGVSPDFFTIYDFGPVVSFTAPASWSLIQNAVGPTAPATSAPTGDNPGILNATFFYTDGVINADPATELGLFTLISPTNFGVSAGSYTAQDSREAGNDGVENSGTFLKGGANGFVNVPAVVPTPTAGFGGLALFGLLALKKLRSRI